MKVEKIYGPPGTGKTTRLMQIIESLLDSGVDPRQIRLVSHTKKAVNEAVDRAIQKFLLPPEAFVNWSTLHAACFRALPIKSDRMITWQQMVDVAVACKLYCREADWSDDSEIVERAEEWTGNHAYYVYDLCRNHGLTPSEGWDLYSRHPHMKKDEFLRFVDFFEAWKQHKNMFDFADLLHFAVKDGQFPPCQYLIVDEAQDLSTLQWQVIDRMQEDASRVWIAGDDDQSIFGWSGARPENLIQRPGDESVLPHSWRLPRVIHAKAQEIIQRVQVRADKEWAPRDEQGVLEYVPRMDLLGKLQGDWMILGRNRRGLVKVVSELVEAGRFVDCCGLKFHALPDMDYVYAALMWEKIRRQQVLKKEQVMKMLDYMKSGGFKLPWGVKAKIRRTRREMWRRQDLIDAGVGVLDSWEKVMRPARSSRTTDMIIRAMREGVEDLEQGGSLRVSTIHRAKGGEADNVLLLTDMSRRSYDSYMQQSDEEHRVWYVGATRARHRLVIQEPTTSRAYHMR